jgi:hypothetical protein
MHACFQYPAMMVPKMQGELIHTIIGASPQIKSLYEPFIGSGTVLTEAMQQGLNLRGQDINPLSILLCRAKSGPFYADSANERTKDLLARLQADRSTRLEADFTGLKKWFRDDVAIALSKIRRAIRVERYLWCRRFFWLALAETVRQTSNSRTTTYKLHIRTPEDIQRRDRSPLEIFETILSKNLERLTEKRNILQKKGLLKKGKYIGEIQVSLKDTATPDENNSTGSFDILVTSPPYGDNRTTISYGQHSYLPLQWIDLKDIDQSLDQEWLESSYEIDRRSLGGSLRRSIIRESEALLDVSFAFRQIIADLQNEPEDRRHRVAAFFRDINRCIDPVLAQLKSDAYMVWTVGNRNVAGRTIPMNEILADLLIAKGSQMVVKFDRTIPSKRMAILAGGYDTIGAETILVMRNKAA